MSDIHAASMARNHARESYVQVPPSTDRRNPIADLQSWVRTELRDKIDYLVCPGDITNQADPDAFRWMWEQIHSLAAAMGAREIHATCGNHDLDSRYLTEQRDDDPDPRGAILSLSERFPALSESDHNHYWAHNFVILERDHPERHRILLLNTSAYHGGEPNEVKHGRISGRTIERIEKELIGRATVGLNIAICHHHLIPLPSWSKRPDYEYVRKGTELVQALESAGAGPWLVVHGHRHWPDCIYAPGGASSPVIFCAGAFGKSDPEVSNQFHLLEVRIDSRVSRPRGIIKTWEWTLHDGWQPCFPTDKVKALAYSCGFGFTGELPQVVEKIIHSLPEDGTYLDWTALVETVPELQFLLPRDFKILRSELKKADVRIHVEHGEPIEIALRRGVAK